MESRFGLLKGIVIVIVVLVGGWLARYVQRDSGMDSLSELPGFAFEDVTEKMGITFHYQDPHLDPKIQGKMRLLFPGSGVAVADFNGDGWLDILLVNATGKNQLYINQQGHGFKESAEEWGIADTNKDGGATVAPVVFDYDNDGRPDVFLARMGCSMLFHNIGTRFENVSADSGLTDCRNSIGAVPLDYDNDGKLDLYVLRYWRDLNYFKLPSPMPELWAENLQEARNGGANTLYRNLGNGRFSEASKDGGGDAGWATDAAVVDAAGDGVLRTYVVNNFGPDKVWAARAGKVADESDRVFDQPDRRWGFSVAVADLDHDGLPHLLVANEAMPHYSAQRGNFLWKFDPRSGRFNDTAHERDLEHCGGWPWGAAFADFDLDGREDLFVASGFISGKPGEGSYHQIMRMAEAMPGALIDLPQWPDIGERSLAGDELPCVFWNRGSRFANVAQAVGVAEAWDSRAVGLIDFDNDGTMDLIITTQDGPAHLLKNSMKPSRRWLSVTLVGTRSNRDGVGARVELVQKGQPPQYRWDTGGHTGFLASSDPRLHFGLPVEGPATVTVRWPSGLVEAHPGLEPGRNHVLTEGAP